MSIRLPMVYLMLAGVIAAPAVAAPMEKISQSVSYADLDLASKHGVAQIESRVRRAARRVCGVGEHRETALRVAAQRCSNEAVANSRVKIASAIEMARSDKAHAGNATGTGASLSIESAQ